MLISSVSIFAPFLFTVNSNLIVEYMKNSVKDHFCSLNKVVLCENLKSNPYRYLLTTSEGTYVEALLYCVFERELCIPSWIEIHTMWAPLLLRLDLECMSKTKKAFNLIGCEIKVGTFWEEHKIWKNLLLKIWCYKWKIFSNLCSSQDLECPNFNNKMTIWQLHCWHLTENYWWLLDD